MYYTCDFSIFIRIYQFENYEWVTYYSAIINEIIALNI